MLVDVSAARCKLSGLSEDILTGLKESPGALQAAFEEVGPMTVTVLKCLHEGTERAVSLVSDVYTDDGVDVIHRVLQQGIASSSAALPMVFTVDVSRVSTRNRNCQMK